MKKLILLIICLLFFGCSNNPISCYESVVKKYPEAIVYNLAGDPARFIVLTKNGSIRYVRTLHFYSSKITSDILIKK